MLYEKEHREAWKIEYTRARCVGNHNTPFGGKDNEQAGYGQGKSGSGGHGAD